MTANDPAQVTAECSIARLESLAFARREIPDMPIGAASILATRCKQPPAQRPTHPRPGLPFAMLIAMEVAEKHFVMPDFVGIDELGQVSKYALRGVRVDRPVECRGAHLHDATGGELQRER